MHVRDIAMRNRAPAPGPIFMWRMRLAAWVHMPGGLCGGASTSARCGGGEFGEEAQCAHGADL